MNTDFYKTKHYLQNGSNVHEKKEFVRFVQMFEQLTVGHICLSVGFDRHPVSFRKKK